MYDSITLAKIDQLSQALMPYMGGPMRDAARCVLEAGLRERFTSDAGSRYYVSGPLHVRISDHAPNEATRDWMDARHAIDIRVCDRTIESPYHSNRTHISRGQLATFADSRREFEGIYITGTIDETEDNSNLRIGTATHAIALDDVLELSRIKLIPKEVLAKNGARSTKAYEQFAQENADKTLLKESEWEMAVRCNEAIQREIGPLLKIGKAHRELEIYWDDILPCRCKLDFAIEGRDEILVIDIKTAADNSSRGFWNAVKHQRYWLQDAHYSKGAYAKFQKPVKFMFATVRKTGAFECRVFELDSMDRDQAAERQRELLTELKQCLDSGNFANEFEGHVTTLLPLGNFE